MIEIPTETLPALMESGGLAPGSVFVYKDGDLLPHKQKVVLETKQGGRLELLTQDTNPLKIEANGTYLHALDNTKIIGQTDPKMRRYRARDTWAKVFSAAGLLTSLTALLAVLTAVVGTAFVLSTLSAPAPTTVNDRAQALLQWVATAKSSADPTAMAMQAESCLKEIRGDTSVHVTLPDVDCTPVKTPWWRQSAAGSIITGIFGVLTAALGAITVASKFGFQKSPAT